MLVAAAAGGLAEEEEFETAAAVEGFEGAEIAVAAAVAPATLVVGPDLLHGLALVVTSDFADESFIVLLRVW